MHIVKLPQFWVHIHRVVFRVLHLDCRFFFDFACNRICTDKIRKLGSGNLRQSQSNCVIKLISNKIYEKKYIEF